MFRLTNTAKRKILEQKTTFKKAKRGSLGSEYCKDLGAVDLWSWLHISFPRKALENPQAWPTPVEASEIP